MTIEEFAQEVALRTGAFDYTIDPSGLAQRCTFLYSGDLCAEIAIYESHAVIPDDMEGVISRINRRIQVQLEGDRLVTIRLNWQDACKIAESVVAQNAAYLSDDNQTEVVVKATSLDDIIQSGLKFTVVRGDAYVEQVQP